VAQSGCPILVRAFCAAEPGPHRARCWRGGVERGIASLPTSSKLRVPHIPGVGMWESCKARPFPHPRTIRVPHPGARFFAQQGGIASLPTRSKLRVPHIPGVGMWVSCKARPSCRPKNPLFLACHPERSERTSRLLFAPSTMTPSANINPAQQDEVEATTLSPTTTPSANINPAQQDDGRSHGLQPVE